MTVTDHLKHNIICQNNYDWEQDVGVDLHVQESDPALKRPPLYKVIILNDDYTPMDFVIEVLERFFNMNNEAATRVMMQVHTQGRGVCGVYSKDVAETKAAQVNEYSRQNDHPLLCEVECQEE